MRKLSQRRERKITVRHYNLIDQWTNPQTYVFRPEDGQHTPIHSLYVQIIFNKSSTRFSSSIPRHIVDAFNKDPEGYSSIIENEAIKEAERLKMTVRHLEQNCHNPHGPSLSGFADFASYYLSPILEVLTRQFSSLLREMILMHKDPIASCINWSVSETHVFIIDRLIARYGATPGRKHKERYGKLKEITWAFYAFSTDKLKRDDRIIDWISDTPLKDSFCRFFFQSDPSRAIFTDRETLINLMDFFLLTKAPTTPDIY
jgi:hypothetical protein